MSLSYFRRLYESLPVQFSESANLRKIISNIWWLLADNILRMGTGLFVGAWVARYLGPKQFGILNYAMGFVGSFEALAIMGRKGHGLDDLAWDPPSTT